MADSFEIHLPAFQGPFDLLLFFIERDELDIKDIPIASITDEFLAYIRQMEKANLEVASEFILVAATLMNIKTKMLLPRQEANDQGIEIDPREELVRHLLEYKKYKSVLHHFVEWEEKRLLLEKRGNIAQELKSLAEHSDSDAELQDLDLYKLLKVYIKVSERYAQNAAKPVHTVVPYPYSVDGQKDYISQVLSQSKRCSFEDIIVKMPTKIAVIFNFLAILELLHLQKIAITVGEGFNNFWLSLPENIS